VRKRSARIHPDYWLIVSEERPQQWTFQVWGPVPFSHDGIHPSAQDAESAAIEAARKHFERQGLPIDVPDSLTSIFQSKNEPENEISFQYRMSPKFRFDSNTE